MFAPISQPKTGNCKSLWQEMERRYDTYKAKVVRLFFKDLFSRKNHQIFLIKLLVALHKGPQVVEDIG